jgi:magnesium transporter
MSSKVQIIKENDKLEWIDITNPTSRTLKQIQKKYNFNDLDVSDCLSLTHRSKVDYYNNYTFAIFLYPYFIRETREIVAKEFDFWIGKNYLISVHDGIGSPLSQLFKDCKKSVSLRKELLTLPPERLLYEIHLQFVNYCMPMIKHMDEDIDNIEKMIFSGHEKEMVKEISIIRRNITDYRKILEPHKTLLEKLMKNFKENRIYAMKKNDIYFDNLIDYANEIWNALETFKEQIEALQETNESLISFKLNDLIKILTIVSLITFPANLLASIFGMNTNNPPIQEFWPIINIMLIVGLIFTLAWVLRVRKFK